MGCDPSVVWLRKYEQIKGQSFKRNFGHTVVLFWALWHLGCQTLVRGRSHCCCCFCQREVWQNTLVICFLVPICHLKDWLSHCIHKVAAPPCIAVSACVFKPTHCSLLVSNPPGPMEHLHSRMLDHIAALVQYWVGSGPDPGAMLVKQRSRDASVYCPNPSG